MQKFGQRMDTIGMFSNSSVFLKKNRFGLRPGQWTDDFSMGVCLADSLLVSKGFQPLDLRMRFVVSLRSGIDY